MGPLRVLIVDDSALVRQVLAEILSSDPVLEVVGSVSHPLGVIEAVERLQPDVVTLDVEMPGLDGLTLLRRLMQTRPVPVVMISSATESGCEATVRALELGALDFVAKPRLDIRHGTEALGAEVIEKVKAAARAKRNRPPGVYVQPPGEAPARPGAAVKLIAIGASTGGTEALRAVLAKLPEGAPPVLVAQHMPAGFTRAFAGRLDSLCRIRVREAADGDPVAAGQCLVAPGGFHLELAPVRGGYCVRLTGDRQEKRHRPSVDRLFRSCARWVGAGAVGVLLTGMGDDGAEGMLAMRHAGCRTIAQDEASSAVFGMPRAAIERGAASEVVNLHRLAERLLAVNSPSYSAVDRR
ncbi:MAG: chemotaxis response regulator protein-glutamate methylesterase [Bryobacteraceae bacterium]